MPTVRVYLAVELEVDMYHNPPDKTVGYRGCTEAESVRIANPDEVLEEINGWSEEELKESIL